MAKYNGLTNDGKDKKMGDRFVVGFRAHDEDVPVWVYSHYNGGDRREIVAGVIEDARPRWDDATYATRIAISNMIGDDWGSELGYGISAGPVRAMICDHDMILVTWYDERVMYIDRRNGRELYRTSFDAFIDQYLHEREEV